MPDLDRLRTDELRRFGFLIVSEREAKHIVRRSFRYKCDGCGLWVIELYGKAEELRCRECYGGAVTSF